MSARISILSLYLFLSVFFLPMFPHGGSDNELTRWATAASLIEHRSFEISWTESLIGKNVDTAQFGEKIYSNKAPGTAVLAAPFYGLTRIFIGAPNASNIRVSWFVMRLFISTLPLLFLAFWLYRKGADVFSLAALLFATPLFLYSQLFFSHVFVAVLLYFAFRLLYDDGANSFRRYLWAGLLSGMAVISEFPAIFIVAIFGVGLLFTAKKDRYRRLAHFVLGGAPSAILLMVYNAALFGSPFSLSYAHESFAEWAETASRGVFGIGLPTPSNAFLLLVSPARGLFFFSPILILSAVALFTSPKRKSLRHSIRTWVVALFILLICGHGAAHAGWAMGARYLILILPFLLDPIFRGEISKFSPILRGSLFTASVLLCLMPALTFPFAPPEFHFPHHNFWKPLLLDEHWVTPVLLNCFGLPSGGLVLIPFVLALAGLICVVDLNMPDPKKFGAGILVGIAAVAAYVFLPNLDNGEAQFRRATIAERFFRPGNRLEPIRNAAKAGKDWQRLQRINDFEWSIADRRAYAPDDFPYLKASLMTPSPTAELKKTLGLQQAGKSAEVERLLQDAKEQYPFGRCEISTNLAVLYYTTNRKEMALRELESVQPLLDPGARPGCLRSQFLLGTLYQEANRTEDARRIFHEFLVNSENATDPETKGYRQKLKEAGYK
jgi:hypothetical protein